MLLCCIWAGGILLLKAFVIQSPSARIRVWQILSRYNDFYSYKAVSTSAIARMYYMLFKIISLIIKNGLGNSMLLEINTNNIGSSLVIGHFCNVINSNAKIGRDLHLAGNCCIGNGGESNLAAPEIEMAFLWEEAPLLLVELK